MDSGKIIAACGDNCAACPRHLPKTDAQLDHTAELWVRIGYRTAKETPEQIGCTGCKESNFCRFDIIGCAVRHAVKNCGQCREYPCAKIEACFAQTETFRDACKRACTEAEMADLEEAFFRKREHLEES